MAKLGSFTHRWENEGPREDGGRIRTELALRNDGALLRKHTWLKPDGHLDFTDGWKLVSRHPKPLDQLNQTLLDRGFWPSH